MSWLDRDDEEPESRSLSARAWSTSDRKPKGGTLRQWSTADQRGRGTLFAWSTTKLPPPLSPRDSS